jgi:ATP-dependent protease HslVU (ClpYQ) peptidase subunit
MSTVVAIQGQSWAVVGYDSQVSEDGGRKYLLPPDAGKVVQNNEYIFGVAGDLRAVNILAHAFIPPTPGKKLDFELDEFISTKFVTSLRKCFEVNSYGKDGEHSSSVIVVVNGTVYEIGGNYDWIRDGHGLYAIGTGSPYALGAMHSIQPERLTIKVAKDRAREAVRVAAVLDSSTCEPITIVTQHWSE